MLSRSLAAMTLLGAAMLSGGEAAAQANAQATNQTKPQTTALELGLLWTANRGQWHDEVLAASIGGQAPAYLTRGGLVVGLGADAKPLRVSFPVPSAAPDGYLVRGRR